jgi:hypothetical protein
MRKEIIPIERLVQSIRWIRGQKVLLDSDLATLYGVTTGNLNKAVKRNADRFPSDFMFQLKPEELANLKFQFGISSWGGRRRSHPYVFTEQGIKLRQMLETNRELARKFSEVEQRVGKHDEEIAAILEAIRQLMAPPEKPRREIGFHVREKPPRYRVRKRA